MLHGLQALAEDPATKVILLVSKPPAPEVAQAVLAAAEASTKPVVAIFLGADPATITRGAVHGAGYLAQAADFAVALALRMQPVPGALKVPQEMQYRLREMARAMAPSQRFVRGVFSGGTFCFEAQLIHAAAGHKGCSNTPTAGFTTLPSLAHSEGHTIIDMGDDAFTQGRPHPMIDPSLRDARLRQEVEDASTAVVLFDVVLGYGSSLDPIAGLLPAVGAARAKSRAEGRSVVFIAHVCGTDADPQDRAAIVAALKSAGALVATSNAEAATWSAILLTERQGAAR